MVLTECRDFIKKLQFKIGDQKELISELWGVGTKCTSCKPTMDGIMKVWHTNGNRSPIQRTTNASKTLEDNESDIEMENTEEEVLDSVEGNASDNPKKRKAPTTGTPQTPKKIQKHSTAGTSKDGVKFSTPPITDEAEGSNSWLKRRPRKSRLRVTTTNVSDPTDERESTVRSSDLETIILAKESPFAPSARTSRVSSPKVVINVPKESTNDTSSVTSTNIDKNNSPAQPGRVLRGSGSALATGDQAAADSTTIASPGPYSGPVTSSQLLKMLKEKEEERGKTGAGSGKKAVAASDDGTADEDNDSTADAGEGKTKQQTPSTQAKKLSKKKLLAERMAKARAAKRKSTDSNTQQ